MSAAIPIAAHFEKYRGQKQQVPPADSCTVVIGSIRPCQPFDFTDFSVCLLSLSLTSWVLSWEFSCRFCTGFKLSDRALTERGIARQVMRVENAVHVAQGYAR